MPQLSTKEKGDETIVTVCDSKLFGETFREGDLVLEVTRSLYEGRDASVEECLSALKDATIANLVGSIIDHAIDAGYISPENVLEIDNVKHAQMARL